MKVVRRELIVRHAAGLDGDLAAVAADAADVSPGERHEAVIDDGSVGVADLLLESLQHRYPFRTRSRMPISSFMIRAIVPRGSGSTAPATPSPAALGVGAPSPPAMHGAAR